MASLIVRQLRDTTKDRLKQRAKRHGRSLEAEARSILEEVANAEPTPGHPKGFGAQMAELFRDVGLSSEERQLIDAHSTARRRSRRTRFAQSGK